MKKLTIAIDFDGVLNTAEYPDIEDIPHEIGQILKSWHDKGHTIIINTCRHSQYYNEIIDKLHKYDIYGFRVNRNTPENINFYGSDARKISADVYIDDHNILQIGKPVDFELYDKIIRRLENE